MQEVLPAEILAEIRALLDSGATGCVSIDVKHGKVMGWRYQSKAAAKIAVDTRPKYAL